MYSKAYIKRELFIQPYLKKGYSRDAATTWFGLCRADSKNWNKKYGKETIDKIHDSGFLQSSVRQYGIKDTVNTHIISDLDYLSLQPFNNSFTKWVEDIYTTSRVLYSNKQYIRNVYFSIIQRDGMQIILPNGGCDKECTPKDILDVLFSKGTLELRPSFWRSQSARYMLHYANNTLIVNGRVFDFNDFEKLISGLKCSYVVSDWVDNTLKIENDIKFDHAIKLWIANDLSEKPEVLAAELTLFWGDSTRYQETVQIKLRDGKYVFNKKECVIDCWDSVIDGVLNVSRSLKQINYYTMSISVQANGSFSIVSFDTSPKRPQLSYGETFDEYLKSKLVFKEYNLAANIGDFNRKIKDKFFNFRVNKFCKPGIRPYMQRLWDNAIKDDLKNTKGASVFKKKWMHKHGFFSYRIWQYGVNKENYKDFLSDYDYYWLNRINNHYQNWVNDKTTYRLIMEPFKEYVPKYYLSIYKKGLETVFAGQVDLPKDIELNETGCLKLLKETGKLAFKPSSGTHGDGFYFLEYRDNDIFVNGEPKTEEEFYSLITGQKSFYILTEYIEMHDDLKKIFDKSVNTVRVVVVNSHGYDPQIMQQYIRIGSSKSNYTDNVGYGGICSMINMNTGEYYEPQSIKAHYFYDCPAHPDTGTVIEGKLPNWGFMCKEIIRISRYLGELEYLGFDVAITNDGMKVLEINIHPDLHKVAEHSQDFKDFFAHQIERKEKAYNISK